MTLETTTIVFNSIQIGLIVGGGFWLNTILRATIESKDAEISRLKSESAPAFVRAFADMKKHVETVTEENNALKGNLRKFQTLHESLASANTLLDQGNGMLRAFDLMAVPLQKLFSDGAPPQSVSEFSERARTFVTEILAVGSAIAAEAREKRDVAMEMYQKKGKRS